MDSGVWEGERGWTWVRCKPQSQEVVGLILAVRSVKVLQLDFVFLLCLLGFSNFTCKVSKVHEYQGRGQNTDPQSMDCLNGLPKWTTPESHLKGEKQLFEGLGLGLWSETNGSHVWNVSKANA